MAFKELRETWENEETKGQTEDDVFLMESERASERPLA